MSNPLPVSATQDRPWMQSLMGHTTVSAAGVSVQKDAVEEVTAAQVEIAVREVNAGLELRSIALQFEVDQDTDKLIVKVVDRASGEVIRQIPNEEVVRFAKVMGDAPGMLVDHNA